VIICFNHYFFIYSDHDEGGEEDDNMDGRRGERCLHRPARPRPVMVEMTEIGVSDLGDEDPVGA